MFCRLGGKLPPTHIEPQRYIYIFIHFSPGATSSIYLPTKDAANCVNRSCSRGFRFVVFVEFKMTLVNVSRSMTSSACIHNVSTSPWSPLYEAMPLCTLEMSYPWASFARVERMPASLRIATALVMLDPTVKEKHMLFVYIVYNGQHIPTKFCI